MQEKFGSCLGQHSLTTCMLDTIISTTDVRIEKYGHRIYQREMKASDHTKICMRRFAAVLLVIAKNEKQP